MAARIYQKIGNNMQGGRNNARGWILEYDDPQGIRPDPLTGWAGSGDTQGQVSMRFPTRDAAIAYAERQGVSYYVVPPGNRTLKIQSYAGNFTGGQP